MDWMKRIAPLLLAIVAIAGLEACGSSDDSDNTGTDAGSSTSANVNGSETTTGGEEPAVATIVVRDGEPVGGVQELEYDAGEQVRFRVRSNVADEVHVHGYDVEEEVPAGSSATLSFPADIEGIFEVELHGSEQQIAELRVNP